jgi:hypothetical protein
MLGNIEPGCAHIPRALHTRSTYELGHLLRGSNGSLGLNKIIRGCSMDAAREDAWIRLDDNFIKLFFNSIIRIIKGYKSKVPIRISRN